MPGLARRIETIERAAGARAIIIVPIDLDSGAVINPGAPVVPQDPNGPIDYRQAIRALMPRDDEHLSDTKKRK